MGDLPRSRPFKTESLSPDARALVQAMRRAVAEPIANDLAAGVSEVEQSISRLHELGYLQLVSDGDTLGWSLTLPQTSKIRNRRARLREKAMARRGRAGG